MPRCGRLQIFVMLATDRVPAVVGQEVEQLLKDISAPNGILTTVLQERLPCGAVSDVTTAAVAALRLNPPIQTSRQ
jgi:hypothetical protein